MDYKEKGEKQVTNDFLMWNGFPVARAHIFCHFMASFPIVWTLVRALT